VTHLVFVYGSLLSGEHNHGLLGGATFRGIASTWPHFRLYDLGSFPGVVEHHKGRVIVGEVYEVDDATLARLDRLEGHPRMYERRTVACVGPGLRVHKAWLYVYKGRVLEQDEVRSGNWQLHRMERDR
jgi:gamma-glutamylcyclotransferase (GGCT)/AIG2-like uncharacterized protein YtfP